MITLIMSPMVPCPLNNPAIMFKIAPIITITIRMTSNFTMPTLMMSLIASLMFNAYPRLSVSANLHAPMNKANPKIINRITPTINPRVSLIAPKMAIMIIGMIRYTIAMIMYLQPLIICLGISIEGASSLLSIPNFTISRPYPSTRRQIRRTRTIPMIPTIPTVAAESKDAPTATPPIVSNNIKKITNIIPI